MTVFDLVFHMFSQERVMLIGCRTGKLALKEFRRVEDDDKRDLQTMENLVRTPFGAGNVQINGGQANESMAYWDGAPLNAIGYGDLQALIPTQDALQEFKVMTDNLPAEYDRFAGGIINFTTKTGTNRVHGTAYEYLRNKVLNANNFFNNQSGISVPAFTQNQFGGTFGGPLVIPHLYNGKDKTFFFVSYDGFRLRQGLPLLFTVPTMAERNGDFSNLRDANGNLIPIYDPAPAVFNSATGQYSRTQVGCNGVLNVICPQNIDPTAKILANLWAPPNLPGEQFTNVNNWVGNASEGGDTNRFTVRVDQNVSDEQRFFGRYTINKWYNLAIDPFHTKAYPLQIGTPEDYTIQQAVGLRTVTLLRLPRWETLNSPTYGRAIFEPREVWGMICPRWGRDRRR